MPALYQDVQFNRSPSWLRGTQSLRGVALFSHRSGGDLSIEMAWSPRDSRTSVQGAEPREVVALLTARCKTHTHNLGKRPPPPGAREAWCMLPLEANEHQASPTVLPGKDICCCFCCDREDGPAFTGCTSDFQSQRLN